MIKKIILASSIVSMLALAAPVLAMGTTTNTHTSMMASCIKDATAKEKAALKAAGAMTDKVARKAAIKSAQQQFAADKKACKATK